MRTMIASALALAALGCNSGGPSAADKPAEPAAEQAAAEPAKPAEEKAAPKPEVPVLEEPIFRLALEAKPGYKPGEAGALSLTLTGRGGYHVNQDYPTRVTVTAAEPLKVEKASLSKPDAAEFSEEKARFDVAFTGATAGKHKVTCDVDFAVCTEATCVPEKRTVVAMVDVK